MGDLETFYDKYNLGKKINLFTKLLRQLPRDFYFNVKFMI